MRIFKHNKTGKLYELIQEHLLFKDYMGKPVGYVWRDLDKLVLYKALYDNPDGPYFVRHSEDFFANFTEQSSEVVETYKKDFILAKSRQVLTEKYINDQCKWYNKHIIPFDDQSYIQGISDGISNYIVNILF